MCEEKCVPDQRISEYPFKVSWLFTFLNFSFLDRQMASSKEHCVLQLGSRRVQSDRVYRMGGGKGLVILNKVKKMVY